MIPRGDPVARVSRSPDREIRWLRHEQGLEARFAAFGGPCSVLFDRPLRPAAEQAAGRVLAEARRIESRYSRFRPDSLLAMWHNAGGHPVRLDDESAALIDLADQAHRLSGGRFDLSCGVLGALWEFRQSGPMETPDPERVRELVARVGWNRVRWERPWLTLPEGMRLDLGGLAKEYAVDRCLGLAVSGCRSALLVNFGGDLAASGPRGDGSPWRIGIEDPLAIPGEGAAAFTLELAGGAIATSGDARRFRLVEGRRMGHILDPFTGWPVIGAPRSVTVAAVSCTQAGLLATLAMLEGAGAERFLEREGVEFRVIR